MHGCLSEVPTEVRYEPQTGPRPQQPGRQCPQGGKGKIWGCNVWLRAHNMWLLLWRYCGFVIYRYIMDILWNYYRFIMDLWMQWIYYGFMMYVP